MTQTIDRTLTHTKVDIDKTFESFRSDLRMMSMSSRCDDDVVDDRADDVITLAQAGYLKVVHVMLYDGARTRIRAATFTVNESAHTWKAELPGGNIWPVTPSGWIQLVVEYTAAWGALSEIRRERFRADNLVCSWGPSNTDTTFSDLVFDSSRRYASNAYGLEQRTYKRSGT